MEPSVSITFWCAVFGGLAIKLLELAELPKVPKAQRPDFKDVIYWLPFLILPGLGGGLAYVYVISGIALKPILAFNVGASAPLIIRTVAQIYPAQAKPIDPGPGA